MINSNIDYALIGHNYLTFLLSQGLMKRGMKVLLLDDDRFNYGDFFTNSLTQIDLDFIKKFGIKTNSATILNLDNYLKTEERLFYVGKKQVLLGRSPGLNLMELVRKFPDFFTETAKNKFDQDFINRINQEYYEFIEKVSQKIIFPEKKIKLFNNILENAPDFFKVLLNDLTNSVVNKENESEEFKSMLITLIYLTRGFYQSHFSTTGSRLELAHNLMALLSPYYRLNVEAFNADLLKEFKNLGGDFKKLNLGDLKFHRGIIKGMELQSYEGLINPKKVIFVGGHPLGLPIKFERPKNIYHCLFVRLQTSKVPIDLVGKKIVFSSPMKMSTQRPMFEADFFENSIELNVVVQKKNGIKIDFIKNQILEEILSDLSYIFESSNFTIQDSYLKFTHDIFIEELNQSNKLKDDFNLKTKLSEILYLKDPLSFIRPKNVYYLGPYNDGFLGTLSSLIEIYRWQEKI